MYDFHLLPSGIVNPDCIAVIGNILLCNENVFVSWCIILKLSMVNDVLKK